MLTHGKKGEHEERRKEKKWVQDFFRGNIFGGNELLKWMENQEYFKKTKNYCLVNYEGFRGPRGGHGGAGGTSTQKSLRQKKYPTQTNRPRQGDSC